MRFYKTAESVCAALGFKLDKTWGKYLLELPKLPWTSIYLTFLELDSEIVQPRELQERILYALYYGLCGLKYKDAAEAREEVKNVDPIEVKSPENVIRKEKLMDLGLIINDIQNIALYLKEIKYVYDSI